MDGRCRSASFQSRNIIIEESSTQIIVVAWLLSSVSYPWAALTLAALDQRFFTLDKLLPFPSKIG
jgi:hypothetical protein